MLTLIAAIAVLAVGGFVLARGRATIVQRIAMAQALERRRH